MASSSIRPTNERLSFGFCPLRRPPADDQVAAEGGVIGLQRSGSLQDAVEEEVETAVVLLRHEVVPAAGDVDVLREEVVGDRDVERPPVEEPHRGRLVERSAAPRT